MNKIKRRNSKKQLSKTMSDAKGNLIKEENCTEVQFPNELRNENKTSVPPTRSFLL